jgi:Flp pilus assembly protein TadG
MSGVLTRLWRDERGVNIIEFALASPLLFMLIMGSMDIARGLYAKSVMEGELQRAARKSSLESGGSAANQKLLDEEMVAKLKAISAGANVKFERKAYDSYKRASLRFEDFTDGNGNGKCDKGEPFVDRNSNGAWDTDAAVTGQGGAKDVVLYTATVEYPRIFPLAPMLGLPASVKVSASTVLRNQPYDDQAVALVGKCK